MLFDTKMGKFKIFFSYVCVLSFFGITPVCNGKFTVKSIIKQLIVFAQFGYYLKTLVMAYFERSRLISYTNNYQVIIYLMKYLLNVIVAFSPIYFSLTLHKCWSLFIIQLKKYHQDIQRYENGSSTRSDKIYLLLIYVVTFVDAIVQMAYMWDINSKFSSLGIFLLFVDLYQVAVISLIVQISHVIRICYTQQANILTRFGNNGHDVRKFCENYSALNDFVVRFNRIFGWQILYLHANAIIAILYSTNNTFKIIKSSGDNSDAFSLISKVVVHVVS